MKRIVPIVLFVSLLSSCSRTFTGRVILPDGRAVAGARVDAAQYPSFLGVPPWQWFVPARYIRGSATTDSTGAFTLRAKSPFIDELHVRSAHGFALLQAPNSRRSLTIPLHHTGRPAHPSRRSFR